MFGFTLKKEYVLNKIKEYLNYQEELDFMNLPESFKEVLEDHFSIECLNNKNNHSIISELKNKVNELNPECDIEKLINLVCLPDGELNIGFVMKDELQIIKSFSSSLNRSQYFNETSVQTILNELKEFIGFQYIQSDIHHLEIKLVFDYERFGISFIQDFIDSDGPALTKELFSSLLDPNETHDYDKLIQFI
jgi:hypothetical protein